MNLNLHTVHFSADEKLLTMIKEKCNKLQNFNDTITSVDVYLKLDNVGLAIKDKIVEIKVNILKNQIFIKETSKTFEESFSIAIDSTIAQLKRKNKLLKSKVHKGISNR